MYSALGGLQRQAQHRLLVEVVLTEDDAAGPDTKQEMAEGCEDSDGLGTQRSSCPSRDRARASLRRLRPTAWRCTQPDAHAAAINESEGSEPLSQLLQAVATTGKRLPWAHLAAREEAAAVGMGVSTSGRGADGDQTAEAETRQGKQQQSAAQDWSWLASPPWGVVPLPPELACRVDPHGRLRPGTCGAEAIATHAESVASACPPHAHSDPHCAQLHTQLHRMTAAVQQVLAVAAAANLAAEAQAAAAAAANGEASSAPPQLLYDPDWQSLSKRGTDGTCALEVASARVHTITEQWVMLLAAAGYGRITPEGQQYLRPSSAAADAKSPEPPVLPRSQSLLRSAQAGLGLAEDEAVALQTKTSRECQLSEKALYPAPGKVSLMVMAYRAGEGGGGSTRASRAALKQLLEPLTQLLLKTSTAGGPGPAGSVCSWQQLAAHVSEWSGPCKMSAMWSWLLACVVAEAEADEAVQGLTPPLEAVQEPASRSRTGMGSYGGAGASAGLPAAWRQAAEEVGQDVKLPAPGSLGQSYMRQGARQGMPDHRHTIRTGSPTRHLDIQVSVTATRQTGAGCRCVLRHIIATTRPARSPTPQHVCTPSHERPFSLFTHKAHFHFHTHTHTHTHTRTHTSTHAHIYTHIHICSRKAAHTHRCSGAPPASWA